MENRVRGKAGAGSKKWPQGLDSVSRGYRNPDLAGSGSGNGQVAIRTHGGSGSHAARHTSSDKSGRKAEKVNLGDHRYVLIWIAFCLTVITLLTLYFGAH